MPITPLGSRVWCRLGATWLCLVVVGVTGVAHAQRTEAQADRDARVLFEAGRTYFEQGAYEHAYEQFERAYALSHRAPLLMNMYLAAERMGRIDLAIAHLEAFLSRSDAPPDHDSLARRLENLRARHARQNGAGPAETSETSEAPTSPDRRRILGMPRSSFATYTVGLAGLATFGTFGALALREHRSVEAACDVSFCARSDLARLRRYTLVADASAALAAGAAVLGTVLFFVHRDRADTEEGVAAFVVVPYLDAAQVGLAGGMRF